MKNSIRQNLHSLVEPKSIIFGAVVFLYIVTLANELRLAEIPTCSIGYRPNPYLAVSFAFLFPLIALLSLWLNKLWSLIVAFSIGALMAFGEARFILLSYIHGAEITNPSWNISLLSEAVRFAGCADLFGFCIEFFDVALPVKMMIGESFDVD